MLSDNLKSYLHLHLIVFIWGFTAVLGALISLDALPLVWFRMLFAVGIILVYILWKKIPLKISFKASVLFLLSGCIIALHWFTFFKAIKVSNISITLACLSTGAFFASLLEPLFYKKRVVWYDVFFGFIVIIGLYFVTISTNATEESLLEAIYSGKNKYILGIGIALLSAFLSALFAVINSKFVKEFDATIISFYELIGGVLFFSVLLAINSSFSSSFFYLSKNDLLYLFLLSSVCTAYAFIASTSVMKFISPFTVMLTINLEPIYGILLAILVFEEKEKMSSLFYIGAVIILFTVVLNAYQKNKSNAM
jgi:drug/metabolite transporter (DMT)-like permease